MFLLSHSLDESPCINLNQDQGSEMLLAHLLVYEASQRWWANTSMILPVSASGARAKVS